MASRSSPDDVSSSAAASLNHNPSRYRSTRARPSHASQSPPPELPSPPLAAEAMSSPSSPQQAGVGRSQSRYHRQRQPTTTSNTPPMPVQQRQQQQQHQQHRSPPLPVSRGAMGGGSLPTAPSNQYGYGVSTRQQASDDNMFANYADPSSQQRTRTRVRPGMAQSPPPTSATAAAAAAARQDRAEARQLLDSEAERQRRMQAQIQADREARERERERQQQEQRQQQQRQEQELEQQRERELEQQRERELQQQQLDAEAAQRHLHEQELERQRKEVEQYELQQRRAAEQRQWHLDEGGRPDGGKLRKRGSASDGLEAAQRADQQALGQKKSSNGLFGLFRKRKADNGQRSSEVLRAQATQQPPAEEKVKFIKQGGGGIVPGTDAPVSAVNAGDRRVHVECNKSKIVLPVTPETTTQDLVRAASTCMSQPIDYARAILVESYFKVGLQRPLRKYEHIRDVLNSWDDDSSNVLEVQHASSAADSELSASQVPRDKPSFESGWPLYYSQKPGKWEKRFVVLLSDGQLTAAKNEDGDKRVNVCHLSDFDIYTPTKQRAKKVKPPKKHCYAIKSQQKSSMFQDVTSYVHYFSAAEPKVAESFYRAVQGWRSWYLVNVMGEGNKKVAPAQAQVAGKKGREVPGTRAGAHRKDSSMDSHYQLGTFESLGLDADQFVAELPQSPPKQQLQQTQGGPVRYAAQRQRRMSSGEHPEDAPLADFAALRQTSRQRAAPPTAFGSQFGRQTSNHRPTSSHGDSNTASPPGTDQNTHAQLNRHSSQRRRPSTDAANTGLQRNTSMRSQQRGSNGDPSSALGRSLSTRTRAMPQPLVDLTPAYKEPPQFQRKGHGYKGPVGPGGLVESATTLQHDAIQVPPSQDWRGRNVAGDAGRPGASDAHQGGANGGVFAHHKSVRGHGAPKRPDAAADAAFTGQGLLATSQAQMGWGDGDKGRPHASMREKGRRDGPMLDMRQESEFQQGSLLAGVQRSGRGNGLEA